MSLWRPGVILPPEKLTQLLIGEIKDALSPTQTVGLTAWAEARSRFEPGKGWVANPVQAMLDVANVVGNRAKAKGIRPKKICLSRWAFSCWEPKGGPDDPKDIDGLSENFEQLILQAQRLLAKREPSDILKACLLAAAGVVAGTDPDGLQTATHYYSPLSMMPKNSVPMWAQPPARLVVERYGHRFYTDVKW